MSFWLREIFGWLFVGLGLLLFWTCYEYLGTQRIFEAGPLAIIGIVLFRGGIHMLKVATAARICREARERSKPERPTALRPVRLTAPVNAPEARGS